MSKCAKQRFRTKLDAKLALAKIQAKDKSWRPKMEKRFYWCQPCSGWHLTSMAGR